MFRNSNRYPSRGTNSDSNRPSVGVNETTAKVRSLLEGLESQSSSRPLTAKNLEQRLAQVYTEIADIIRNEARPLCDCKQITVISSQKPEEFEAEMKRPCPIHEVRRLGVIIRFGSLPPDDDDRRITELLKTYDRSITGVRE